MSRSSSAPPTATTTIGPSPIESVLLVERMERPVVGMRFQASSLPGHLLHLVVAGRVRQSCNGRVYDLGPRSAMWYHEDETVVGQVLAPWTFYSVNFIAPSLPPPEFSDRMLPVRWPAALKAFALLHAAWRRQQDDEVRRNLEVHAALAQALLCISPSAATSTAASTATATATRAQPVRMDVQARLWWLVETRVREQLDQPPGLDDLAAIAQASRSAVERSCRAATGMSPMRRIKAIRLSLARGLVSRRDLSLGEIAARVGYSRIHEFSRDYARAFGMPASRDPRRAGRVPEAPAG